MSLSTDSNLQNNETFFYNGSLATVVSVNPDTVVIDCDGVQFPVKRSELMTNPVFSFNQEQIDKNNELIAQLKEKAANYTLEKRSFREDSKNYLSKMWSNTREWGVSLLSQMDDTQRKTQEALRKDFWAARFNAVDAHNREYNCLSQICRLVSNNA